jgi:hypothetical protein
MSRRRYREIGVRPFAVVLPDPDSRGRWLFYVGDVFIDDCHTARASGGFAETSPALESFRERASAINAAVEGLTMSDDHAASWSVILDALHHHGGELWPGFAKTLALAMGVDVERFPELAPRPAPPVPPIDIRHGGRVRYVHNGTELEAVVASAEVLPELGPPVFVEYSAAQAAPMLIQGRRDVMRIRLELVVQLPTRPPRPDPAEFARVAQAGVMTPNEARQLLDLASFDDPAVIETVTGGGALEVRLQCSSSPRTWAAAAPSPAPICELEAGHEGMCRAGAMAWVYTGGEAVLEPPGSTS